MRENIVLLKVKYTILILIIGILLFLISFFINNKILFLISLLLIILSPYISLYIIIKKKHPSRRALLLQIKRFDREQSLIRLIKGVALYE